MNSAGTVHGQRFHEQVETRAAVGEKLMGEVGAHGAKVRIVVSFKL